MLINIFCSEFCDVVVRTVQHYLIMPDFIFCLSWVGTSSFYFVDMHGVHLTKKWGTVDTLLPSQSKQGKS